MDNNLKEDEGITINLETFSKEEEIKKFDGLTCVGWRIAVRLYVPLNKVGSIILPGVMHEIQEIKSCVGLVIKKPKAAYLDQRYEQTGSWCEVGDWVVFPRHAGHKTYYRGLPIFSLQEDSILYLTENPADITR